MMKKIFKEVTNMTVKTKSLCITAIGIALFVVLSLCLQVPIFENYYLCLGYSIIAIYCYSFGIKKGIAVGFFGVILYCLIINGLRGMPGWAIGNLYICFILGITCKIAKFQNNIWIKYGIISISIILSTAIGILGVKSIIECMLYSQPFWIRILNNIYAFIADCIVLIISIPLCQKLHPILQKRFPELCD